MRFSFGYNLQKKKIHTLRKNQGHLNISGNIRYKENKVHPFNESLQMQGQRFI